MYCSTTRLLGLLLAALPLAAAAQFVPDYPGPVREAGAASVARDILYPAQLEIETSGSSHFQISQDAIIGVFSGGVVSRYRGYELRCESLRLNQATGIAVLSGGISATGPELELACERLQLNVEVGAAELWGGIHAQLKKSGITLQAGHIKAILIDSEEDISLANLRAGFDGNLLMSRGGQQLSTARLDYDGGTGALSLPEALVASLPLPEKPESGTATKASRRNWLADLGQGTVAVAADSFVGTVTANAEVAAGELVNLRAALGDSSVFAQRAQLQGADTSQPRLQVTGQPVSVLIHARSADPLSLLADNITIRLVSRRAGEVTLLGQVRLQGRGLATSATELAIQFDETGRIGLAVPEKFGARGDFRRLLDLDELNLQELTDQFGR